jgi:hypothetical protein
VLEALTMLDLAYIGLTILLFVLTLALIRMFGRM